jgi:tyrosine-protein phosphatase SIW14
MRKIFLSFLISCAILICITIILLLSRDVPSAIAEVNNSASLPPKVLLPENAKRSELIIGLPGISNVGRIAPGILRGNQPKPEGYETLRKMGIRTIINFRTLHDEKAKVEIAGMSYVEYPISMLEKPKQSDIRKIVGMMADPANQPLYIHCALGQDRTGIIVAAYRMDIDGWSLQDAIDEMHAFGFHEQWVHLKKFIIDYGKKRAGK